MEAQGTPSRKRTRQRFLFEEVERTFLNEEDDAITEGFSAEQLALSNEPDIEDEKEDRGAASVIDIDEPDGHEGVGREEGGNNYDEEIQLNAVENLNSERGATSSSNADPPFVQQANILQSVSLSLVDTFPELNFSMATGSEQPLLQISQRHLHNHPPFGMLSRVLITVEYNYYTAYIMMRRWESVSLTSLDDLYMVCLKFSVRSQYKFCPGIDPEKYETEYRAVIGFRVKSVRQTEFPFARVDSVKCLLWFELAPNAKVSEKASTEVRCGFCKRLISDLECQKRRKISESPSRKVKRQSASSRARLSYMSPASQLKRRQNAQYARNSTARKLAKYAENEVTLNEEQHDEMCSIVERTKEDDLEKLVKEGNEHGVGNLMKEIWFTDKKRQSQQFANDQAANGKCWCSYIHSLLHSFLQQLVTEETDGA